MCYRQRSPGSIPESFFRRLRGDPVLSDIEECMCFCMFVCVFLECTWHYTSFATQFLAIAKFSIDSYLFNTEYTHTLVY
jgi:glycogen debranching enzyme